MARMMWLSLAAVGALGVPAAVRFEVPQAARTEAVYYVSSGGNDATGAPDDAGRPYRSPAGAFAAIPADITRGPGDHVIQLMDDATYGPLRISNRVTDANHRIVLRAAPGRRPTLDADFGGREDQPALWIQASQIVVQGIHFINTNVDPSLGPGAGGSEVMVRLDGSYTVIEGNHFDGIGRTPTPTDMFLLVCNTAHDNLIAGNRFDYSGGKSLIHISASCGGGSPGRQIIRNNVLSRFGNNPQVICAAINFGGQRGTLAGDSSIVENNTIYHNGGGCYGLLDTNGSTLTVRNNIFSRITGHRYAIGCDAATGTSKGVAENSVMFGNTRDVETACWSHTGTVTTDPQFVNPTASPPDLRRRPEATPGNIPADGMRTISFETSEVTAPDVAVSPDGTWLVFTMLGKLFRLPVMGGEAEQLTFGPYYDAVPAISPDGRTVAFQSDRDSTAGNIFLLNLATAGTHWEPTLGIAGGYAVHVRTEPERFRPASRGNEQLPYNTLLGRWAEALRTVRAAYDRGVLFLPGTDRGHDGLALQWELEFFAEAGIPPLDVLCLATKEAARVAGAGADLGSLEPGKLADLVLLDADPLEDIKNTQKIWRVFKGGWQFGPKVLLPPGN